MSFAGPYFGGPLLFNLVTDFQLEKFVNCECFLKKFCLAPRRLSLFLVISSSEPVMNNSLVYAGKIENTE